MSFLGLFGSGNNPYDTSGKDLKQFNRNNLNPYINNGMWGSDQYKDLLTRLMGKSPVNFENSIMSQYQQSPWAKHEIEDATTAANRAAAAGGYLGTPQEQQGLADNIGGIVSKDQQQFYNNAVNPYEHFTDDELHGLSDMGNQGLSAQQFLERYLESLANNDAAQQGWNNQNRGFGGFMHGIGGLLGAGDTVAGMGGKNGFGWW